MRKDELVKRIAVNTDSGNTDAARYVEAFLAIIERELAAGEEVRITGFGKFKVSDRPAREGVNPQTGERRQIQASRVPSFTAGDALKKAIN